MKFARQQNFMKFFISNCR